MSFFLDIDRAQSVFQLFFLCCYDSTCAEDGELEFEEALRHIALGVQLPKEVLPRLRSIHDNITSNPVPFSILARKVAEDFSDDRDSLICVLRILLRISSDDNMLCQRDRRMLSEVGAQFDLAPEELLSLPEGEYALLASCLGGGCETFNDESLIRCYQALGCTEDMDDTEVRKRFRKLAKRFHPDHCEKTGDSSETNIRFRQIHEAYETIIAARQLSR